MMVGERDLPALGCGSRKACPETGSENVEEGQNPGVQRPSHGSKLLALAVTGSTARERKLVAVSALVGLGAGRIWILGMSMEGLVYMQWGFEQLRCLLPLQPRSLWAKTRLAEDEVGTQSSQSVSLPNLLRGDDSSHVPWIFRAISQNVRAGLKFGVDEGGLEAPTQKPVRIQSLLDELLVEQGNTCLWPGQEAHL